jgi:hypothetical protein
MLTGYNTDIKHEGVIYHVQTEDGGTENPVIVSLIYRGGRILASRKTSYAHLLGTDNLVPQLRDLLENQHKSMIKSVLSGTPGGEVAGSEIPSTSEQSPSLLSPAESGQPPVNESHHTQTDQITGNAELPANPKPPLEVPPETTGEAQTDSAAEKNLDQVILEYLASEIDKD